MVENLASPRRFSEKRPKRRGAQGRSICSPLGCLGSRDGKQAICRSVLVEHDAMDDHLIALAGKLHVHRDTDLNPSPNNVWLKHLTAPSHIYHFFAEVICAWSAGLFKHNQIGRA